MTNDGFKRGIIEYTLRCGVMPAVLAGELPGWQDGYVAFANAEKRLGDIQGLAVDEDFLSNRINGRLSGGIEGYVTELDFWRKGSDTLEEIAAEREETTYRVQRWTLRMFPGEGEGNCWHRPAATMPGPRIRTGPLFAEGLASQEVVWPEKRLNFFISRG
jgi:hypothetical protein